MNPTIPKVKTNPVLALKFNKMPGKGKLKADDLFK